MKRKLVILTGPTAVGKSALSVQLAQRIGGEIISADSMQVYRHMDIGTAKITKDEMQTVPHYLIDEFEPDEAFNIVIFQKRAKEYMDKIYQNGQIPMIVGGTGFYIQSILYDIDFEETYQDDAYRNELEALARQEGAGKLHEMLKCVDHRAAAEIHENNVKRVIRALEYHKLTGKTISEHNQNEREKESPYDFRYFVLNDDRAKLYAQIDARIDKMIQDGLVDEVKRLRERGFTKDMVSMQGLGYKEILACLDGECTLEEAIYILKRDTRHFAKRQLTWFRREKNVIWIDKKEYGYDEEAIIERMRQEILCTGN